MDHDRVFALSCCSHPYLDTALLEIGALDPKFDCKADVLAIRGADYAFGGKLR